MYDSSTDAVPEPTRQRLLRAAVDCIRADGITRTSSRAIAARAEANLGSITYYFGSKDELLAQALLSVIHEQLDPVLAILGDDSAEPQVRLLSAVGALMTAFEAVSQDAPTYVEALLQTSRLPALESGVRELFTQLRSFLAGQVRDHQASGRIPSWIDPEATAGLLLAVGHGVVITSIVDPAAVDHRAVGAQYAALLLAVAS